MEARVRRLQVNINGAAERDRGESFARQILARFCAIVEDRFPGQDISIGRVDLRCALSAGQLTDPGEVLRCARELAASIDEDFFATFPREDQEGETSVSDGLGSAVPAAASRSGAGVLASDRPGAIGKDPLVRSRRRPEAGPLAINEDAVDRTPIAPDREEDRSFEDEVASLVAFLRAGTVEAWLDAPAHVAHQAGTGLAPARRRLAIVALSRLHAAGEIFDLLARLTPSNLALLLETLDVEPSLRALVQLGTPDRLALAEAGAAATGEAAVRDARVAALLRHIPSTLPPDAAAVAVFILEQAELPVSGSPDAREATKTVEPGKVPVRHDVPRFDNMLADKIPQGPDGGIRTRFGGLFYLLSRVLELGIGETLWKVCLPEGQVLATAAGCILGDAGPTDPAASVFGDAKPAHGMNFPMISREQQEEISTDMLSCLIASYPSASVDPLPAPVLDIAAVPSGRLLIATCGFPAPIFAWPAPDAASVTAGIEAFLRCWPIVANPPEARPALLDFERSARLRKAPVVPKPSEVLLPNADQSTAAGVLAQLCGSVLTLFHARLQAHGAQEVATTADLVTRYLALPARITLAPEEMRVLLPMDSIDMAIRRAGLDRDPGWVPWLRRTVRIEFEPVGPDDVV